MGVAEAVAKEDAVGKAVGKAFAQQVLGFRCSAGRTAGEVAEVPVTLKAGPGVPCLSLSTSLAPTWRTTGRCVAAPVVPGCDVAPALLPPANSQ